MNEFLTAFEYISWPLTAVPRPIRVPFAFDYIQVWQATGQVTVTIQPRQKTIGPLVQPLGIELQEKCPQGDIMLSSTVAEVVTIFVSAGGVRPTGCASTGPSPVSPAVQVGGFVLEGAQIPFSKNMPVIVGMKGFQSRNAYDLQTEDEPASGWALTPYGTLSPQNLAAAPAAGYRAVSIAAGGLQTLVRPFSAKYFHVQVVGMVAPDVFNASGYLWNGGLQEMAIIRDRFGGVLDPNGNMFADGIYTFECDRWSEITLDNTLGANALDVRWKLTY